VHKTDLPPLPGYIVEALADSPRYVDRKTLALIIGRMLFPVSDRSLGVWPLKWRRVLVGPPSSRIRIATLKLGPRCVGTYPKTKLTQSLMTTLNIGLTLIKVRTGPSSIRSNKWARASFLLDIRDNPNCEPRR
jgi:hypothetical protein